MAAAKKISGDAVVADLSELHGIFTLREEQKNGAENEQMNWRIFLVLLPGFGKSLAKHRNG